MAGFKETHMKYKMYDNSLSSLFTRTDSITVENLLRQTAYQVQIRHRSVLAKNSLWSDWSSLIIIPAGEVIDFKDYFLYLYILKPPVPFFIRQFVGFEFVQLCSCA